MFTTEAVERGFVGRRLEVQALCSALESASHGRGASFVITGEPGIGKTRLANETAKVAAASGFGVVSGSCLQGGRTPALFFWRQILRSENFSTISEQKRKLVEADLARFAVLARPAPDHNADPKRQRSESSWFRLLDNLAKILRDAANRAPLL